MTIRFVLCHARRSENICPVLLLIPLSRTPVALLLCATLAAQDAAVDKEVVQTTPPFELSGSVDLRYVSRTKGGAHDNDLFAYSRIGLGDPNKHVWTARASGRVAWDLDRDRGPADVFRSIDDRRSGDVTGRLYSAYLDLNGIDGSPIHGTFERVRLGRQVMYETPQTLFLDGLSAETSPVSDWGDLIATAYVGVPSHLFESSPSGDLAAGGAVSFAPWKKSRVRLDYMHFEDKYLSSTYEDDLLGLRIDQYVGQALTLNAYLNVLDFDTARDFGAFASYSDAESDFNATLRYTALLSDEDKRRSIDLDYFTEILATYYAYDQYELSLYKGLGENLYAEGGIYIRELRRDRNEGLFNREFQRYYLTAGVSDWPHDGMDASLTFEFWDSGDEEFTTIGGDLSHAFDEELTASVGTLFEAFRYDPLRGQENEDVQVSYAKLKYRMSDATRLKMRLAYEDGETDNFFTLILGLQVDF